LAVDGEQKCGNDLPWRTLVVGSLRFNYTRCQRIASVHPYARIGAQNIEGAADMTLSVVPEGLAAASAGVAALTARLAAAHAAAAPLITAVVPPAADPVSLQSAAEFSVRGGLHTAVAAQGAEELGRAGIGVGESGASYASGDAAAASSYVVVSD
jgi:PE family